MSKMWLIEREAWKALEAARKAGFLPSSEQAADFSARISAASNGAPRNLKLAGNVAQIDIVGVLTKAPDWLAYYFGGGNTTYGDIQAALALAEADPNVKQIALNVDSPGGQVDGLFETIDALRAVTKPIKTRASLAASAAFALATNGGKIEATGPASTFGSVGVVAAYLIEEDIVEVTSSAAPKKRPDPTTAEGQSVIREHLDEIHSLFAQAIADGRGTTVDVVNAEFGQGGVYLAAEAKRRNMIDSIAKPALKAVGAAKQKASAEGGVTGEAPMKWSDYKAAHPQEAAIGIAEGVTGERERTEAHLTMGEQCGDMKIAIDAVKGGVAFGHGPTQAKYLGAAMNRRDQQNRTEDDKEVADATKGAEAPAARDLGDQLADAMYGAAKGGK
jgi:ClpP class serine protease